MTSNISTPKILLVSGQDFFGKSLRYLFQRKGIQCTMASDGSSALSLLEKETFDVVLTELLLEFNSGMEVVEKAKQKNCQNVIVMTRIHSNLMRAQCILLGANHYFETPLDFQMIYEATLLINQNANDPAASN